jgi:alpha-L-fucosidase
LRPQKWGCLTLAGGPAGAKGGGKLYVHVLQQGAGVIRLEQFPYKKIGKAYLLKSGAPVAVTLKDGVAEIPAQTPTADDPDQVVVVEVN